MAIELITAEGAHKLDFTELVQTLEALLKPGVPVMLKEYTLSDLWLRGGLHTKTALFISGGHLSKHGVFDIQKGNRNFSYVSFSGEDSASYKLVRNPNGTLDNYVLSPPETGAAPQYNEGSFSQAGPARWASFHSSGTSQIVIGDALTEQFPDALHALNFARDAIYFDLPPFYLVQGDLIMQIGDKYFGGLQGEEQANELICLTACMKLIDKAGRKIEENYSYITMKQVGTLKDGESTLRRRGHPVDDLDYVAQKESLSRELVALIKVGKGSRPGETYIRPASEKMKLFWISLFPAIWSENIIPRDLWAEFSSGNGF